MAEVRRGLTGDAGVLAFLIGVELAIAEVYADGASHVTSPDAIATSTAFHAHHRAHAAALTELLAGTAASPGPNRALLATLASSMQVLTDEAGELELLHSLEEELAATYHWAVGRLAGSDALQHAAAILSVEGQHAVALGTLLSKSMDDLVPSFQGETGYLVPADFGIDGLG
jgi:hypothetical protein